jgi:hypothetical protein
MDLEPPKKECCVPRFLTTHRFQTFVMDCTEARARLQQVRKIDSVSSLRLANLYAIPHGAVHGGQPPRPDDSHTHIHETSDVAPAGGPGKSWGAPDEPVLLVWARAVL